MSVKLCEEVPSSTIVADGYVAAAIVMEVAIVVAAALGRIIGMSPPISALRRCCAATAGCGIHRFVCLPGLGSGGRQ